MFAVGDKVRVVNVIGQTDYFRNLFVGKTGVVQFVTPNSTWCFDVKLDEKVDGTDTMCFEEKELEVLNV